MGGGVVPALCSPTHVAQFEFWTQCQVFFKSVSGSEIVRSTKLRKHEHAPFSQIKCTYYLRPFIYIHLYYLEPGAGYVFFLQIYSGLSAFIQIYVVVNFLSQVIFIFLLFQLH